MSLYAQFIVLGLAAGGVYAVFANCLVAVYRATGIINFAQGAMAMWGAFVMAQLNTDGRLIFPIGSIQLSNSGLGLWPSMVIGIVYSLVITMLCYATIFRFLRRAPVLAQVVASVGLLLFLQALVSIRFGTVSIDVKSILPNSTWTVGGASLSQLAIYVAVTAILVCLLLWLYFQFTRYGTATRVGSDGEFGLRLMGFSPDRLAAIVWACTGLFASAIVVFASPSLGLDPNIYTLSVVSALAVALVGFLRSFWVSLAAGFGLGAFQAVVTLLSAKSWWPDWGKTGLQDAVPFIVIVVVLAIFGNRVPSRGRLGEFRLPPVVVPRMRPTVVTAAIVVSVLAMVLTQGSYRFALITSAILVILYLSFTVLTGYLGQISLAQMAFAGAAGYAVSKLTNQAGLPFPIALLLSALVATVLGIIVGLPALRIRGAQLAVVTLAAAAVADSLGFENSALLPLAGLQIKNPSLFGMNLSVRQGTDIARLRFGFTVLVILGVLMVLLARILGGSTGRSFLAVRSNERAAASVGVNVARTKLLGFAISAFLAGVSGALIGYSQGQVVADSYTVVFGLTALATAYLGGIGSYSGAVVAGLIGPLGLVYVYMNQTVNLGTYYPLIAAGLLILTSLLNPVGIAGGTRQSVDWLLSRAKKPRDHGRSVVDLTILSDGPTHTEEIHADLNQ